MAYEKIQAHEEHDHSQKEGKAKKQVSSTTMSIERTLCNKLTHWYNSK